MANHLYPLPLPLPPPHCSPYVLCKILIRFMQKANLCLVWRKTQINNLVMGKHRKGKMKLRRKGGVERIGRFKRIKIWIFDKLHPKFVRYSYHYNDEPRLSDLFFCCFCFQGLSITKLHGRVWERYKDRWFWIGADSSKQWLLQVSTEG